MIFFCKEFEQELGIQKEILKQRQANLDNLKILEKLNATNTYAIVQSESEVAQTKKTIEKIEFQISNRSGGLGKPGPPEFFV